MPSVPVVLTVVNSVSPISVSVPACLPVTVLDGYVVTASNAVIENRAQSGAVQVVAVDVQPGAFAIGDYVHVGQRDYSHLQYLMICGCGFPNSRRNFEPAVRQFELLFPSNHTILTVPESPMFSAPEAAAVTVPRLELVKQAGRQYAETGAIDAALLAETGLPMIPEDVHAKIVNSGQ